MAGAARRSSPSALACRATPGPRPSTTTTCRPSGCSTPAWCAPPSTAATAAAWARPGAAGSSMSPRSSTGRARCTPRAPSTRSRAPRAVGRTTSSARSTRAPPSSCSSTRAGRSRCCGSRRMPSISATPSPTPPCPGGSRARASRCRFRERPGAARPSIRVAADPLLPDGQVIDPPVGGHREALVEEDAGLQHREVGGFLPDRRSGRGRIGEDELLGPVQLDAIEPDAGLGGFRLGAVVSVEEPFEAGPLIQHERRVRDLHPLRKARRLGRVPDGHVLLLIGGDLVPVERVEGAIGASWPWIAGVEEPRMRDGALGRRVDVGPAPEHGAELGGQLEADRLLGSALLALLAPDQLLGVQRIPALVGPGVIHEQLAAELVAIRRPSGRQLAFLEVPAQGLRVLAAGGGARASMRAGPREPQEQHRTQQVDSNTQPGHLSPSEERLSEQPRPTIRPDIMDLWGEVPWRGR